jgi:hypothetical protein
MDVEQAGLVLGVNKVDNAGYHADRKYLSSSVLKLINKDIAAYKAQYIDGGPGPVFANRAALDEGSLAHSRILEPHLVHKEFNFFPGDFKRGADFDNWLKSQRNQSLPIISRPQQERVDYLIKAYEKHPVAPQYLKDAETEFTLCVELEGVPIKVRFDAVQLEAGIISDIKTTGHPGDVESFKQTIKDYEYDLSAALYCMAAEKHFGRPFKFVFIVLAKKEKTCDVYLTSELTMARGKRKVLQALETYKKCKVSGVWGQEQPKLRLVHNDEYEVLEV